MPRNDMTAYIRDTFLFTRIFQTFRIAAQPSKLLLAFSAVVILWLAGILLDLNKTVVCNLDGKDELSVYLNSPQNIRTFISAYDVIGSKKGFFETMWAFFLNIYNSTIDSLLSLDFRITISNIVISIKALAWGLKYHFIYSVLYLFICISVIAFTGGGICRLAALQFARGEKPGLFEAVRYGYKKYTSFFAGPISPFVIIIIIGLFLIFLPGMLGNIPCFGEIFISLWTPLAIAASIFMTLLTIGTIGSFNLIFPAIAYDGADSLDAIGRTFSYVLSKPWRTFCYSLIAVFYGIICYLFVRFFIFLLLWFPHLFFKLSIWKLNGNNENKLQTFWPKPEFLNLFGFTQASPSSLCESAAACIIHGIVLIFAGLLVAFVISFYFTANTIIYAVLRKRVDNIVFDDIYLLSDEK